MKTPEQILTALAECERQFAAMMDERGLDLASSTCGGAITAIHWIMEHENQHSKAFDHMLETGREIARLKPKYKAKIDKRADDTIRDYL